MTPGPRCTSPSDDFYAYAVIEARAEVTPVAADPDDPTVDELVDYYRAVAGEHPDWDDYRRAMVADGRLVLRLHPERAYGMLRGSSPPRPATRTACRRRAGDGDRERSPATSVDGPASSGIAVIGAGEDADDARPRRRWRIGGQVDCSTGVAGMTQPTSTG